MNTQDTDFYALVLGAGWYSSPQLIDLPAAVNDAQSVYAVLTDEHLCHYTTERTHLLPGAAASLDGFRRELAWLAGEARSTSTALIYFSGHGGRLELPLDAPSSHESYLCFRETDPNRLAETALSSTELSLALRAIHARRLVVIVDSCFAAGAASLKSAEPVSAWRDGLSDEAIARLGMGSGRVVIASSAASQESYVRAQGDRSLFTHHLLEALQGAAGVRRDGYIHVLDVFHYVSEAVRKQMPRQTPILKADDLDSNFPIALDHGGISLPSRSGAHTSSLDAVRQRIQDQPLAGAEALRQLLPSLLDQASATQTDSQVSGMQDELRQSMAVSQAGEALVARERILYLLLEFCMRLEQRVAALPAPAQVSERGPKILIKADKMENTQVAEKITNNYGLEAPYGRIRSDPSSPDDR